MKLSFLPLSLIGGLLSAWALTDEVDVGELESAFQLEQDRLELDILKRQLRFQEGEISISAYQQEVEDWSFAQRHRLQAQAERAALLDKLNPLPATAQVADKIPSSAEETELFAIESQISGTLLHLRRSSNDPFEAQGKIDDWSNSDEGKKLLATVESLREYVTIQHRDDPIVLEVPPNASPAQLRVLDIQEEMIRKKMELKKMHPEANDLIIQGLIAEADEFFAPRLEALAAASKEVVLENLRMNLLALQNKVEGSR